MKITYNRHLTELARRLRNNSTKAEIELWRHLKGKQMMGHDFHRQKPIDRFIADFYCYHLRLVIEVDGYTHQLEETIEKDRIKEERFKELGLTVLRFSDDEVLKDIEGVVRRIEIYISEYGDIPGPS